MDKLKFKAIGTLWCVTVDEREIDSKTKDQILSDVKAFEKQFSRFLPDSEVNSFVDAKAGVYSVSKEFYKLLKRADLLREYTNGVYDPAVSELLEKAGYDKEYSFDTDSDIESFKLPKWSLEGDSLRIDGPISFDLGGIGKGYAIDIVSNILKEHDYKHYVVEAGGDMFGTSKSDGQPWNVAIQYPGRPDDAAGKVSLFSEAVAVSDTFRRRWGKWNHIMNPHSLRSVEDIIGVTSVARTAFDADCITSVLFLGDKDSYKEASKKLEASYLVFYSNGSCLKSSNWRGKVFV